MSDIETTLQVYLVDLFDSIFYVLYFSILIMFTVANIMCQDMVFRNPIPLMCTKSQHRLNFLYLSNIPLGIFVTMIGSTCWNLWQTLLPWKCGTMGPHMSSAILTSSRRIGRFCRMLLSIACRLHFTGWTVILCNYLAWSSLLTSQVVYYFLFYSTCGMREHYFCFWKGASYCGRRYQPWSS